MEIIAVISIISVICAITALWLISELSGDIIKDSQQRIDGEIDAISTSQHRMANHLQEIMANQEKLKNEIATLRRDLEGLSDDAVADQDNLKKLTKLYKSLSVKNDSGQRRTGWLDAHHCGDFARKKILPESL